MSGLWKPAHAMPRARGPATGSGDLAQGGLPRGHPRALLFTPALHTSAFAQLRPPAPHNRPPHAGSPHAA
eukprot:804959-Prymnesium_polylepis.1